VPALLPAPAVTDEGRIRQFSVARGEKRSLPSLGALRRLSLIPQHMFLHFNIFSIMILCLPFIGGTKECRWLPRSSGRKAVRGRIGQAR